MKLGITGHQDLGDKATSKWVEEQMRIKILELKPEEAFSSLAVGADQIFANNIIELKIPLIAVIPCTKYELTFNKEAKYEFEKLLKASVSILKLPFIEPTEEAFFEAGKRMVDESDSIIAVWNNKPAKGLGGTADVVNYALTSGKKVIHINPINKTLNILYNA